MAKIQVLDTHVADLIAAGEVVERPASVVKELMENAFDAGSRAVTVEIANGGMSLIRVTDDGCGIPAGQVRTAFLRHATSKISSACDLEAIGTLGFRGEALAAICAVSRIDLLTRTEEEGLGTSLALEGGVVAEQEEAGCPVGTTIVVRDLFFNTPARLKFMKRDQAEGAAVFAVIQREALAHPEVAVKFFRDGRQDLLTPGDGQLKSAIYAVFGRDIALGFTPVKSSGEDISVEGFISLPVCCRGSRSCQHFFVNGRYVKSLTMQAAVEEAYKNRKMVGKFPGCVLHVTTRLGDVDVNVHPAKTEVKFTSEHRVFSAVYHAVQDALDGEQGRPAAEIPAPVAQGAAGAGIHAPFRPIGRGERLELHDSRPASSMGQWRVEKPAESAPGEACPLPETAPPAPAEQKETAPPAAGTEQRRFIPAGRGVSISPPEDDFDREITAPPVRAPERVSPPPSAAEERGLQPPETPAPEARRVSPARPVEPEEQLELEDGEPAGPRWVIRGELFQTYIVVEQGERALLIDKHAAHERMNFDRLKAADWRPMAQQLLAPVVFSPAPEEKAALLDAAGLLERFGFQVEDFGPGALSVGQAPEDIPAGEIESTLVQLAGRLLATGTADPAAARDELLHTMACKAAIKGGCRSGEEELEAVAGAVMRGEVKYCPHGRPVAVELTRKQLEKQFKRT